ncbi:cytochrome c4 [Rhodanobacter glycinis]|uniref:Cytochrome c4 n=1 Tax=Rhodanobacter glycinis TaxID=582702 RepID=A0A502C143_9GAMM|nr:c-type cytochrome [Rhodanobacter glycinis]TPG06470.1 cytochrome c4 [Rhodanobacter glycinis]TPG45901.1 cytochrome c4 [Rhodanobacter glycinis]
MSFRSAGFRPAVLGSAIALVFALSASALMAQDAQPKTAAPAAAATAAVPASATTAAAPATPVVEAAAKPGDATAGQAKAAVCGACHGMDGNSSDAQYPKLAGQSEQYIVRQLTDFKAAKRQNPIMMGMAAPLSQQDMHDVGAYFASKTPLPGVADQALVEHGQTLFRQGDATRGIPACMACHSIDGRGNPGAKYPQLTSQHAQYIQATLKSWHDGTTWGDDAQSQIMPAIAKQLSADDIAALASYIEGLHSADAQPAATP